MRKGTLSRKGNTKRPATKNRTRRVVDEKVSIMKEIKEVEREDIKTHSHSSVAF